MLGLFRLAWQNLGMTLMLLAVASPMVLSFYAGGWVAHYNWNSKQYTRSDLTGRIAVVTGGNTGLGKQTVRELVLSGGHVIITARTLRLGEDAIASMNLTMGEKERIKVLPLELGDFESIRAFPDLFVSLPAEFFFHKPPRIDILILNAGVMLGTPTLPTSNYTTTKSGFELHIGVNHLGHALLARLLLPFLNDGPPLPRVVVVSSGLESRSYEEGVAFDSWVKQDPRYSDGVAYAQSKLANILFVRGLADHVKDKVLVFSCHPGIIQTDLGRHMVSQLSLTKRLAMVVFNLATASVEQGAHNQLYLATAKELEDGILQGFYFDPVGMHNLPRHPQSMNKTLISLLWQKTEDIVGKF